MKMSAWGRTCIVCKLCILACAMYDIVAKIISHCIIYNIPVIHVYTVSCHLKTSPVSLWDIWGISSHWLSVYKVATYYDRQFLRRNLITSKIKKISPNQFEIVHILFGFPLQTSCEKVRTWKRLPKRIHRTHAKVAKGQRCFIPTAET